MFVATVMGLRNASVHAEANSIREYAPFWIEEELQFALRFEDCSLIVNTHTQTCLRVRYSKHPVSRGADECYNYFVKLLFSPLFFQFSDCELVFYAAW